MHPSHQIFRLMSLPPTSTGFACLGRAFFAIAVIFFGAQHLIYGEFVTRILPAWPTWIPARAIWPYATGVLLIAAGIALFVDRTARLAALLLGALIFASALLLAIPPAVAHPNVGAEWTNAGKAL